MIWKLKEKLSWYHPIRYLPHTTVPGISRMQIAPHPFLQFARLGHILPNCHTGTFFFFFFLQIVIWCRRFCKNLLSGRWNGNLQFWSGSVLMRSHHWTLVTWWADGAGILVPGGRRTCQGCPRGQRGVHKINGPRMIYRAPEVIWWSPAACPRGSREVLPNGPNLWTSSVATNKGGAE